MKNKVHILIGASMVLAAFLMVQFMHPVNPAEKVTTMRILTLKGNNLVNVKNFTKGQGRFLFILSKSGAFYLDTTDGRVWTLLNPQQVCQEHWAIVEQNLREIGLGIMEVPTGEKDMDIPAEKDQ